MKLNFEQRARWEKKARLQREALPDVIATNNHDSVKKTADHAEIETSTKEAETLNKEEKTEKGSKKKSSKRKMTNSKTKKSKKKKKWQGTQRSIETQKANFSILVFRPTIETQN